MRVYSFRSKRAFRWFEAARMSYWEHKGLYSMQFWLHELKPKYRRKRWLSRER